MFHQFVNNVLEQSSKKLFDEIREINMQRKVIFVI